MEEVPLKLITCHLTLVFVVVVVVLLLLWLLLPWDHLL